ncbi:hypothetical protein FOMA001_g15869 [Fusarium oxysporum f. sp. matthiolae]|nr:hypothetical protein FOMA001_g15869 [Fusarium oxysporum f. sp. matthiolae]
MAPATPSRPSTAGRAQHATPPDEPRPLAEGLQEVPMETDEEGEIQSPPIHPNSHEDEVKKLKKKLRDLGEQHNTLLDNAKNNAKIAQNRIEALEKKVADLAEIAESLGKQLKTVRSCTRNTSNIPKLSSLPEKTLERSLDPVSPIRSMATPTNCKDSSPASGVTKCTTQFSSPLKN